MKKSQIFIALMSVTILVTLVGCLPTPPGAPAEAEAPAEIPVVTQRQDGVITAEAVIEPALWNEVAYAASGAVTDVLVTEGDTVEAGQVLARLDSTHQEASVAHADAGVLRAQARLDELKAGARTQEIEAAETAIASAQAQLDRIQNGPLTEEVVSAEATLAEAQADLQRVLEGSSRQELIAAEAELGNADAARRQAQAAYDAIAGSPHLWKLPEPANLERATNNFIAAEARLNNLKKGSTAAQIAAARARVQRAQAQVDLLQAVNPADVAAAEAEIRRAESQLDLLQAGARPETIAAAEADLAAAHAALEQAKISLADLELRAPMSGTVIDARLDVGDQIVPGQPVFMLADLNQFFARTTDLNELDIAQVSVGQPAVVTVDALPGREFEGIVNEIGLEAKNHFGDVVYDVVVELIPSEGIDTLRWGMTALVEIDTK